MSLPISRLIYVYSVVTVVSLGLLSAQRYAKPSSREMFEDAFCCGRESEAQSEYFCFVWSGFKNKSPTKIPEVRTGRPTLWLLFVNTTLAPQRQHSAFRETFFAMTCHGRTRRNITEDSICQEANVWLAVSALRQLRVSAKPWSY